MVECYSPFVMTSTRGSALTSDPVGAAAAEALFHGLADRTRLQIVQRLAVGELRVTDLMAELELPQSTVSKHLGCLRECGLVAGRPEGRQTFYSLTRPELFTLLDVAESLLAATGYAVALCPTYGRPDVTAEAGR